MKHSFLFFKFLFILCLAAGLSIPGLAQKSPTPKSGTDQDTDDSSSTSGSSSAWNGYRLIQVRLPAPLADQRSNFAIVPSILGDLIITGYQTFDQR